MSRSDQKGYQPHAAELGAETFTPECSKTREAQNQHGIATVKNDGHPNYSTTTVAPIFTRP